MKKPFNLAMLCLLGLLVVTAGSCINTTGCRQRAKYEKTIELRAPLESGSTVVAKTSFGSITAEGADVADCSMVAKICVQAPTEAEAVEIAEQIKIQLQPEGDRLTIKADKPRVKRNRLISISYQITVPRQTNIECSSSYGSVELSGMNGSVNAHTSFGSIDCRDIEGRIKLDTAYGKISCSDVISDELTVRSSYGGIDIEFSDKALAEIQADVGTAYGSIDFKAPGGFAGEVELGTSYGSIETDLPVTVKGEISNKRIKGTIGEGNGKLRLKTSFGSIKIR